MAEAFKRGKVWHYDFTVSGQRYRGSTGLVNKREAQQVVNELVLRAKLIEASGGDKDITFAAAVTAYIEDGGSPNHLDKIVPHWGTKRISELTPKFVRSGAKELNPNVKPQTLNRQFLTPVQAVLNHAYQNIDGRRIQIKKFSIDPVKKKVPVDSGWHAKFKKAAHRPQLPALARFMFQTGARVSEALREVTWKKLDEAEPLEIEADGEKHIVYRIALDKTKTTARVCRITSDLYDEIMDLERIEGRNPFFYPRRQSVYGVWRSTCKKAGIDYAPPHTSGRHSYATEMVVRNSVDPVTAAELGGWSGPDVMMNIYAHSEKPDEEFGKVFGKKKKSKKKKSKKKNKE